MTTASARPADLAPVLSVRTQPIPAPAATLTDLLPVPAAMAWTRNGDGLIAWGEVAQLRCRGPERFATAGRWWQEIGSHAVVRDDVGLPGSGLVAFGSFTFADDALGSALTVPRYVIGHREDQWWVTTIGADGQLPPLPPDLTVPDVAAPGELAYADGALSAAEWEAAVAAAVGRIAAGELDKVVLARDLVVQAQHEIDPRWALRRLAEQYPSCFTFAVDGLFGASPELLVRLDGRLVTSRLLAGTIRRTGSLARDEALAGSLSRSSKDREEHEYAVASVAEALATHCTGMNVPESPFVMHLPNVMHLATEVTGVISDDSTALDLVAALHPTAAVGGTPTPDAVALIAELEGMDRGRYAGPVGWLSAAGTGEFAIALRCGELDPTDPRRARLFAGCGIVADSDPEAELAESNAKLIPMRDALDS